MSQMDWIARVEAALLAADLGVTRVTVPSEPYALRVTTKDRTHDIPMVDALVTAEDFPDNVVRLVRAKVAGAQ